MRKSLDGHSGTIFEFSRPAPRERSYKKPGMRFWASGLDNKHRHDEAILVKTTGTRPKHCSTADSIEILGPVLMLFVNVGQVGQLGHSCVFLAEAGGGKGREKETCPIRDAIVADYAHAFDSSTTPFRVFWIQPSTMLHMVWSAPLASILVPPIWQTPTISKTEHPGRPLPTKIQPISPHTA